MTNEQIKAAVKASKNAAGFEMAAKDYNTAINNGKFLRANNIYLQTDKLVSAYKLPFNTMDLMNLFK